MRIQVEPSERKVYFQGKYPDVMAIPGYMKSYPGYEPVVLSHENFVERYGETQPLWLGQEYQWEELYARFVRIQSLPD